MSDFLTNLLVKQQQTNDPATVLVPRPRARFEPVNDSPLAAPLLDVVEETAPEDDPAQERAEPRNTTQRTQAKPPPQIDPTPRNRVNDDVPQVHQPTQSRPNIDETQSFEPDEREIQRERDERPTQQQDTKPPRTPQQPAQTHEPERRQPLPDLRDEIRPTQDEAEAKILRELNIIMPQTPPQMNVSRDDFREASQPTQVLRPIERDEYDSGDTINSDEPIIPTQQPIEIPQAWQPTQAQPVMPSMQDDTDSASNAPAPPSQEPVINIAINRLTVRANTVDKRSAPQAQQPSQPRTTLDDFLTRRKEGR